MAFQVSPGVNVSEIDLTTVVPAVSTTEGAIAGNFRWGPVNQRVLVDSEDKLVSIFNKPNANTADDFFTAANFLSYGNALYVVRVVNDGFNATSGSVATVIENDDDYLEYAHVANHGDWIAKYPGEIGNSLKVSVCSTEEAWSSTIDVDGYAVSQGSDTVTLANTAAVAGFVVGDVVLLGPDKEPRKVAAVGNTTVGTLTLASEYSGNTVGDLTNANTALHTYYSDGLTRQWEYSEYFELPPTTTSYAATYGGQGDSIHIAVIDEDGLVTGQQGTVIEIWDNLSTAVDGKTRDGAANYYKEVINQQSAWLWWGAHNSNLGNAGKRADLGTSFTGSANPITTSMTGGVDGAKAGANHLITGYNLFRSPEDVDVSLVLGSANGETVLKHLINNIAEFRKDCLVVFSPERTDVVNNNAYAGKSVDDSIEFRNLMPSTSYAVMDSAWKYQYDKYNDLYRWVPMNGDTAGLMVQTDLTRDPWYSPAGFNRGNVKNIIKLSHNPNKAERDALYKAGINPVVTFPGQGTVLFGDKTLLAQPSAFDRINVRRLFIVLEKAISIASKFTLFEFNDEFTRSQFKNLVEPFLRDVQGRRGITDFQVICDGTNNTGEVIDRNEFVGDIYIKPARSINFIQLNFVAVRTGVEFTEIVGRV